MTLADLIKAELKEEDRNIILQIDFTKTDEEIITYLIEVKLLNFFENKDENQKNQQD